MGHLNECGVIDKLLDIDDESLLVAFSLDAPRLMETYRVGIDYIGLLKYDDYYDRAEQYCSEFRDLILKTTEFNYVSGKLRINMNLPIQGFEREVLKRVITRSNLSKADILVKEEEYSAYIESLAKLNRSSFQVPLIHSRRRDGLPGVLVTIQCKDFRHLSTCLLLHNDISELRVRVY